MSGYAITAGAGKNIVENLSGAVLKESSDDIEKLKSYFATVVRDKSVKEGGIWEDYYKARSFLK